MSADHVGDKRSGRFWMDDLVLDVYGAQLGVYGLAVYTALCRRAGKNDASHPSIRRIATDLGMSDRQAKRELKKLMDLNLISARVRYGDKGRQLSSEYTILEPPRGGDSETPGGEGSVSHPKEDTEKEGTTLNKLSGPGEPQGVKKVPWMAVYRDRANLMKVAISPEDEESVPNNLNRCAMKEGAADDEMHALISRMLLRRKQDGYPLSPQAALNDIRGVPRKNGKHSPQPKIRAREI